MTRRLRRVDHSGVLEFGAGTVEGTLDEDNSVVIEFS